jgi:Type II secretion system (T2SS), protein G
MNRTKSRTAVTLACAAAVCLSLCAPRAASAAKGVKKGDAQKAIAATPPFELNTGAVTIKEISSTESAATVLAGVKVAFRFVRGEGGAWRATGVRVGDRKWEEFDLLARAAGAERVAPARAALDALAAELEALALARKRDKSKAGADEAESRGDKANAGRGEAKAGDGRAKVEGGVARAEGGAAKVEGGGAGAEGPLVRGVLRVEKPSAALSPMGSSAVVEAEIEAAFELARVQGKWRVVGVRSGGETLGDLAGLAASLDAAKRERARADLERLAAALEAFRRERGFYVVADTGAALVDHLTPRYTREYIRFDPWHRPYDYEGTAAGFLLRSQGPDGKPGTADDVTVRR